jgi:hypothetical protein
MNNTQIITLVLLFLLLIILLALSVYIKPILETFGNISVDISGTTYTGQVTQQATYEIDVSGVTYTGTVDGSFNQPQIINENNVYVGTGVVGRSGAGNLNDIYFPGTTAGSGGTYTSPLDFASGYNPTSNMYTDISGSTGTIIPNASDVANTSYGIPEAEESQLGTLGVDYRKCMEADYTPLTDGTEEPIGTYIYLRDYGSGLATCAEQVAPCAQFSADEERCTAFSSRQGTLLCDFTAETTDLSSNCAPKDGVPFLIDAPVSTTETST